MNNIKCAQCGLVNWSSAVECKRCGSVLTVQELYAQNHTPMTAEPEPFFSGGLKFLTALLALATVAVLLSRANVVDIELAKLLAIFFMLGGMLLLMLTHIWLVVRIFEQSVMWGLGSLFVPFVGLIAIIKFWDRTRRSFVGQMVCFGIVLVGYLIVPMPN